MQIGLIGLGVMGRNLALQLRDRGVDVHVTDPWPEARDWSPDGISVHADTNALIAGLTPPRLILLMIKAGAPTDDQIAELAEKLSPGDAIADGGNSLYHDTARRARSIAARELGFLGIGISGGAEGARNGAAMMVGGPRDRWDRFATTLQQASASSDLGPAVEWFGEEGAGHFVKMVHNGIEYAVMQALAEVYDVLRHAAGLEPSAIGDHFAAWGAHPTAGYLVEISSEILKASDAETGGALIDVIGDRAGQKGTGNWTVAAGLDYGVPLPSIFEAVAARQISSHTPVREAIGPIANTSNPKAEGLLAHAEAAYHGALVAILAQGWHLLSAAASENDWPVKPRDVARVWSAGSILRMRALSHLVDLSEGDNVPPHLIATSQAQRAVGDAQPGWHTFLAAAVNAAVPAPVLTTSLAYTDALSRNRLSTALIQAQRDRFGGHGFERVDRPGMHHGPWGDPTENR